MNSQSPPEKVQHLEDPTLDQDDHDLDEYDESIIKPDDFDSAFNTTSLNNGIKLRVTKIKSSPGIPESPQVFKNSRSF